MWDWIYDADYTNWDPFMWPSYRRPDATLSPSSTHGAAAGHRWQIYNQSQCMPCYFIRLIYTTAGLWGGIQRGAAAESYPPLKHADLNLSSAFVCCIHYPACRQPCQRISEYACIGTLFTRRQPGDVYGVKLLGERFTKPKSARINC